MDDLGKKVPLPERSTESIRLVSVELDSETHGIRCVLHATELNSAVAYIALSYTWRSPLFSLQDTPKEKLPVENEFDVECNGETIQVQYNLFHALRRLGNYPFRGRHVWIDFLCIDQNDNIERNHQVNMMARIYSTAEKVVVWLGPEDEHSEKAVPLIEALGKLDRGQLLKIEPHNLDQIGKEEILEPRFCEESSWISLARFFCRNWFSRAWVIQEVLLAQKVTVFCGHHELSWKTMREVSGYLSKSQWTVAFKTPKYLGSGGNQPLHGRPAKLKAAKETLKKKNEQENILLHSLIRARNSFCQDPRDKVFSLLGIASKHAPDDVQILLADYGLEVHEVYTKAAIDILQSSKDLHILAHAEGKHFRRTHHLPSWVPDWSVTDDVGLRATGYERYCAAGKRPRDCTVVSDSLTLNMSAACVACISHTGESQRGVIQTGAFPGWIEILQSLPLIYSFGESSIEAFWRTLIVNTDPHDPEIRAHASLRHSFRNWVRANNEAWSAQNGSNDWSKLAAICDTFWTPESPPVRSGQEATLSETPKVGEDLPPPHAAHYGLGFSHRSCLRLYRTKEGFLGFGTESLENEDTIWIVPGSRVPLIFRRKTTDTPNNGNGSYELVGGTYLHGFMYGEALDGIPRDHGRDPLKFEMIEVE